MRRRDDRIDVAPLGRYVGIDEGVLVVLLKLETKGIHVVALHNHMVGEQPAYYFTHFWGKGKPEELAAALKSALDAQAKAGKKGH